MKGGDGDTFFDMVYLFFGGAFALVVWSIIIVVPIAIAFDIRPADLGIAEPFDAEEESLPPYGTDILLTASEVSYCFHEAERLRTLRNLDPPAALIGFLAQAVEDYNERCSRYRADPADLELARTRTVSLRGRLVAQAELVFEQWSELLEPGSGVVALEEPSAPRRYDLQDQTDATVVQRRLQDLGYYAGAIDGLWGPRSRAALKTFKIAVGLPRDSRWTWETQDALLGH